MAAPQSLTHDTVDDLVGALQRGRSSPDDAARLFIAHHVEPFLELALATAVDPADALAGGPWAVGPGLAAFRRALAANRDVWTGAGGIGFYRTRSAPEDRDEGVWTHFRFKAQLAAESCGFHRQTAKRLVGAIGEIEDNIHEHSGARRSGVVAFQARPAAKDRPAAFAFVVGDAGMGVLDSLRRSPRYTALDGHGEALSLALSDGESRFAHEDPARGTGFRGLFVGLASLRGRLRFTSGDHALAIQGRSPSRSAARLIQKPLGRGFFASVVCAP